MGEEQHANVWRLKDDVTVEATCREPTALLYRLKQRVAEQARLCEPAATGPHVTRPFKDCSFVTPCVGHVGIAYIPLQVISNSLIQSDTAETRRSRLISALFGLKSRKQI